MINFLGPEPRSTRHATFVRRVRKYLEKKCSVADYERELVTGYKTDALGYNRKGKIWYLCEIKVEPSDLKKAPQQILDTKFHFPKTRYYHKGDTIVPVIAIPAKLANYLVKVNEWDSLKNTCKMVKVAIWVVEQSNIREFLSPKTNKTVKTKSSRTSTTKKKPTRAKKTASKTAISKIRKPKATKKKTTQTTKTKPKKTAGKSLRTKKKQTTQSVKPKISRVKVAKAKSVKKKR